MRFLTHSLSCLTLLRITDAASDVCSTTTSFGADELSWYTALGACASINQDLTTFTQESLDECANDEELTDNLLTHLGDSDDDVTHDCTICAVTFANALVNLFKTDAIRELCVEMEDEIWHYDEDLLMSVACTAALAGVVDEFNACADNGLDISTGISATRCTLAEFRDLQMNYTPYESLATAAFGTDVANTSANADIIEAADLTDAIDALSTPCQARFSALIDSLQLVTTANAASCFDESDLPAPLVEACLNDADVATPVRTFATNSKGYQLSTITSTHCDDSSLINDVLRPYRSLVACSNLPTYVEQEECMNEVNGFFSVVDSTVNCFPCYADYLAELYADEASQEECGSDPFDERCLMVQSLKGGPLYLFAMCAGFEMNTDDTTCSSQEKTDMGAPFETYAHITTCALYPTALERSSCLANVHPMYEGFLEGSTSGCLSCYWALMEDVAAYAASDANLARICRNPHTEDCMDAMTGVGKPLDRFTSCAGFDLVADSGLTCSDAEFNEILNMNLPFSSVVTFAFMSNTATQAFYLFDEMISQAMTEYEYEWTDLPCLSCFYGLIQSGYNLKLADKETCYADINSADCHLVFGVALETFHACTGQKFVFAAAEEEVTTTVEVTEETTTTTEAVTESTTAAATTTTSKSASTATYLLSLIALIATMLL